MKKVSLTRQLKAANEIIAKLKEEAQQTAKKLESAESNRAYYTALANQRQAEIDGVNSMLDAMPNPPPTKTTADYPKDLPVQTRLAVWLASR